MIDAAFLSHVIFWFIGAMVVCGGIGLVGAMVAMSRTGYRKD